jgi:hypothetical protein
MLIGCSIRFYRAGRRCYFSCPQVSTSSAPYTYSHVHAPHTDSRKDLNDPSFILIRGTDVYCSVGNETGMKMNPHCSFGSRFLWEHSTTPAPSRPKIMIHTIIAIVPPSSYALRIRVFTGRVLTPDLTPHSDNSSGRGAVCASPPGPGPRRPAIESPSRPPSAAIRRP